MGLVALVAVAVLVLTPFIAQAAEGKASWTILVYMAADNDLEHQAIVDLAELEAGRPGPGVNIVVLIDRSKLPMEKRVPDLAAALGDWDEARVYRVVGDGYDTRFSSEVLEELGEVDTGDPKLLAGFIRKYAARFPAEHYMLVIWDHGDTFGGTAFDYEQKGFLTPREISEAIRAAGVHIDVLVFDACLMGSFEVAYQVAGLADYLVASEELVPGRGLPYDALTLLLEKKPQIKPRELAEALVSFYGQFYTKVEQEDRATLSALDLRRIAEAKRIAEDFAAAAAEHPEALRGARRGVEEFGGGDDPAEGAAMVDLIGLLQGLRGTPLENKAKALMEAIEAAVVASYAGPGHPGAHGVSIYFPMRYDPVYNRTSEWASGTKWSLAVRQAANVDAQIDAPSDAQLVHETGLAGGGRVLGILPAAADLDGDGGDEVMVAPLTLGEDGSMSIRLIYFDRKGNSMEMVNNVLALRAEPGQILYPVNAFAARTGNGELAVAAFFTETLSGDGMSTYTAYLAYAQPGSSRPVILYTRNLYLAAADALDVDGDGVDEAVLLGVRINESSGEAYNDIMIVRLHPRPSKMLEARQGIDFEEPYVLSDATPLELPWGKPGLALVYTLFDPETGAPAGGRLELVELSPEPRRLGHVDTRDNIIHSVAPYREGLAALIGPETGREYGLALFTVDKRGQPRPARLYSIESRSPMAFGLAVYDFDGDGVEEFLAAFGEMVDEEHGVVVSREAYVYSLGPRGLRLEERLDIGPSARLVRVPLLCDTDGDERPDMVYVEYSGGRLRIYLGKVDNYVDPRGVVKGRVLGPGGEPAEAVVEIRVPKGDTVARIKTGPGGVFEARVPAGTYLVEAASGELHAEETVSVRAGSEASVTLRLARPGSSAPRPVWAQILGGHHEGSGAETEQGNGQPGQQGGGASQPGATTQATTSTSTQAAATATAAAATTTAATAAATQETQHAGNAGAQSTQATRPPAAVTTPPATAPQPEPPAAAPAQGGGKPAATVAHSGSTGSQGGAGAGGGQGQATVTTVIRERGGVDTYRVAVLVLLAAALAATLSRRRYAAAALAAAVIAASLAAAAAYAEAPGWIYPGLRVYYHALSGSSLVSPSMVSLAQIGGLVGEATPKVTVPSESTPRASLINVFEIHVVTLARPDRVEAKVVIFNVPPPEVTAVNYTAVSVERNGAMLGSFWIDPRLLARAKPGAAVELPGEKQPRRYLVLYNGPAELSPFARETRYKTMGDLFGFSLSIPLPPGTVRPVVVLQTAVRVKEKRLYHRIVVDRELGLIYAESLSELEDKPGGREFSSSFYARTLAGITLDLEDRLPSYRERQYRVPRLLQPGYALIYGGAAFSLQAGATVQVKLAVMGMYKDVVRVLEIFNYIISKGGSLATSPSMMELFDIVVDVDTGEARVINKTMKPLTPVQGPPPVPDLGRSFTYMYLDGALGEKGVMIHGLPYRLAGRKEGLYLYELAQEGEQPLLAIRGIAYREEGVPVGLGVSLAGMEMKTAGLHTTLRQVAAAPMLPLEFGKSIEQQLRQQGQQGGGAGHAGNPAGQHGAGAAPPQQQREEAQQHTAGAAEAAATANAVAGREGQGTAQAAAASPTGPQGVGAQATGEPAQAVATVTEEGSDGGLSVYDAAIAALAAAVIAANLPRRRRGAAAALAAVPGSWHDASLSLVAVVILAAATVALAARLASRRAEERREASAADAPGGVDERLGRKW